MTNISNKRLQEIAGILKENKDDLDELLHWFGHYKFGGQLNPAEMSPEALAFFKKHNFDIPAMEHDLEKMQAKRHLANEQTMVEDNEELDEAGYESRFPAREDEEEWRAALDQGDEEERLEDELRDKMIKRYMPYFEEAGFSGHDIDFSFVDPKTIAVLGEALRKHLKL